MIIYRNREIKSCFTFVANQRSFRSNEFDTITKEKEIETKKSFTTGFVPLFFIHKHTTHHMIYNSQ